MKNNPHQTKKKCNSIFFSPASFLSDYQLVVDAQVLVSVKEKNVAAAPTVKHTLFPPYHQISLPLNNLNFIFEKVASSFNQTCELTSDK